MSNFVKGRLYRCTNNLVSIKWLSECHFIKDKLYRAYSDYGLIDDHGSHIGFPSIFNTEGYFVEENEAV